jgi:LysR family transcriptional regulator, cyn operon transcriptional activator
MSPELRHLRYLQAVADQGNFTRAAAQLHVSQPTLSQQIRQLERSVGAQLLDRGGRSVRLTDAGTAYLTHARRALRELAAGERAVHDVTDLSRGHLRLAVTPTFIAYLVAPLMSEFHKRHPGITATVQELTQDSIENLLLADELDVGIAFDQPRVAGVTATTLYAETLGIVAGSGNPIEPLTLGSIGRCPLVLLTPDFATRGQIDDHFAAHRVTPRIIMETNSIHALIEIVRHTPLATVLPDVITDAHPDLTSVGLDPRFPARDVALLTKEGAYQTAANRAFTRVTHEYAQAHIANRPTS